MTCIVAAVKDGKVVIGADSVGSNYHTKENYKTPKLVKKIAPSTSDPVHMALGYTSSYRFGNLLQHVWQPPVFHGDEHEWLVSRVVPSFVQMFKDQSYDTDKNGHTCLIVLKSRVFVMQNDFAVLEAETGYDACGSGEVVAIGAMQVAKSHGKDAVEIAKAGLGAAIQHTCFVGGTQHYLQSTGGEFTSIG